MLRWFILAALLLTPTTTCSLFEEGPHPSDKKLLDTFRAREGSFNRLKKMVEEDSHVVRIAHDFTWLDNNLNWPRPDSELGFSVQRWDEYRRIFREINLEEGVVWYSTPGGPVLLLASVRGRLSGGSEKGYAFSTQPLAPLFESLDHADQEIKKKNLPLTAPVYKRINDNWYLYYKKD